MDLRRAVGEYVTQGRDLLTRLRSPEEGPTATDVDLHILRVQLFLLEHEVANLLHLKKPPWEAVPSAERLPAIPPATFPSTD